MNNKVYGGVEAGGTKFICAVGNSPTEIFSKIQIDTTTPTETLQRVTEFFSRQSSLSGIGIASFGPLNLNKQSSSYGHITNTPKDGWNNVDLAGTLGKNLGIPIEIDTDVNGAALAEQKYGAGIGLQSIAYMTVGTGIGVGYLSDGKAVAGFGHIEAGHMLVPRHSQDAQFVGACPYHQNCLEGMASGTALKKRWNVRAEELQDEKAWDIEVFYLANGIVNIILCAMPQRVVVGGGVMNRPGLIEAVRLKVVEILNGYLEAPEIIDNIDTYIVPPKLGNMSGVVGAMSLVM